MTVIQGKEYGQWVPCPVKKGLVYQYKGMTDTIAAIATAPGAGGVAIVRLSGDRSAAILSRIFSPAPPVWPTHLMHHGFIHDEQDGIIDEVLAVVMKAPRSFTGEEVAEVHTHGGPSAARFVLDLCLSFGARLAGPGEFTRRAFVNGRLDLAQAEAVCDMVSARTDAALRAATHQLTGDLSRELAVIRAQLMDVFTALEAVLNFPEDDTDHGQARGSAKTVSAALAGIEKLLFTARAGKVLRDGVRLVICGRPNVGKSSLLNALLRQDRAIVTDIAGTTRDTLEETANIGGVPVSCVDTAGILSPRDRVEEEAVRRSRASMQSADVVLLVLDRSRPLEDMDRALLRELEGRVFIVVWNKADLPAAASPGPGTSPGVEVSALDRRGIPELESRVLRQVTGGAALGSEVMLTNLRHVQALTQAADMLCQVRDVLAAEGAAEVASEGIKTAVNCLDAVTGRDVDADLVEQIFSRFCIGK